MQENTSMVSHGLPDRPITFVETEMVQEFQSETFLSVFMPETISLIDGPVPDEAPPSMDFRFSNFYVKQGHCHIGAGNMLSIDSRMDLRMRDCNVYGGVVALQPPAAFHQDEPGHYPYLSLLAMEAGLGAVQFQNTLFDRVIVQLAPAWYSDYEVMNVDLRVQAYNNLFRGGKFELDPVPSTQGNWVFKDNLFDKQSFSVVWDDPIDHDYNGYWKRTASELEPWQVDRLPPNGSDGLNDKVVTSAPAYASGPYGNFYLPASGSLYNGGSGTPAQAGLHHYTTRTDQVKDGAEGGNVNLGLHYMATTSSGSATLIDTDSDGIPDFVEDSDGDNDSGDVTGGIETSPNQAQTISGTPDSQNVIFSHTDLDGDGMVGSIEIALTKNSLVADNNITLEEVSNSEGSHIKTFRVPLSYNLVNSIGTIKLLLDGLPASCYELVENPDGNCRLVWNTTFDYPGGVLGATFSTLNNPSGYANASGQPLSFRADNVFHFDPSDTMYYDEGRLHAQTPFVFFNVPYTISLYDPTAPLSTPPFKVFEGTTAGGVINETWDVTGGGVNPYTGQSVKAVFELTVGEDTHTVPRAMYKAESPTHIVDGQFTVALFKWLPGDESFVHSGIQINVVDRLLDDNKPQNIRYLSTFNKRSNGGHGGKVGFVPDLAGLLKLVLDLTRKDPNPINTTRNFYYFGHGNPDLLTDTNYTVILRRESLGSIFKNENDPTTHTWVPKHPYRFVFLDACNTAKTGDWAKTFGIPDIQRDVAWAGNHPNELQLFVGWKGEVSTPDDAAGWTQSGAELGFGSTMGVLFGDWMELHTFAYCRKNAAKKEPVGPHSIRLLWPLGYKLDIVKDKYFIHHYGYDKIKRNGFSNIEE